MDPADCEPVMAERPDGRAASTGGLGAFRVFLVRHGRTALNAQGLLRGRLDPPLDDVGLAEARCTAEEVAGAGPAVIIVSSPLVRAVQTAEAISAASGAPVITDRALADRDYGEWAGQSPAAVIDRWGSLGAAPGVEPEDEVRQRARGVLERNRDQLSRGNVVLVSHDVVNQFLLADLDEELAGRPIRQRTACWNRLRAVPGGWDVEVIDAKVTPTVEVTSWS